MSKTVDDSGDQPKEEDKTLEQIQAECPFCDGTGIVTRCPFFGPVWEDCACNWGY